MTTPVERPCIRRHVEKDPVCQTCQLWYGYESVRALVLRNATRTKPKEEPLACKFRGPRLSGENAARFGLSILRTWYPCAKNHGRGGFVCPCEGCRPDCVDYEANPDADPDV